MTDTSKERVGEWVQHLRAKDEDGELAWGDEGPLLAGVLEALTERAEKAEAALSNVFAAGSAALDNSIRVSGEADALETECADLRARVDALEGALTPGGDTKAAYLGEFKFSIPLSVEDEDGEAQEIQHQVYVPWDTTKEIMAAIRNHAALSAPPTPAVVHASDCAVHNAPALPPGPCDCGADPAVSQKVAAALKWSAENKPGHGLHDVPGVGLVHFNDGSGPSPETLARWERDEDMSQAAADVLAEQGYIASLLPRAQEAAEKAMLKYPQPNYIVAKVAEEAGEVVRGAIHYAEGRMPWPEVEGEIVQLLAMLIRLTTEGDQTIGLLPPSKRLDRAAQAEREG